MTTSAPGTPLPRLAPAELRELFLFEDLDDDQLAWVAANADVVDCPAGTDVSVEGEPAECFFVLLEGTMTMVRLVAGSEVETARTSHRGVYSGAVLPAGTSTATRTCWRPACPGCSSPGTCGRTR